MDKNKLKKRPVFLDLLLIKQPITAIVSIGHRVSGVLLFLSIPYFLWLLDRSLTSPQAYAAVAEHLASPLSQLLLFVMVWSLAHHLFAGLRFLLLDIDVGIELETARKTAKAVNILGIVTALLALVVIL